MDKVFIIVGNENHPDREVEISELFFTDEVKAERFCQSLNDAESNKTTSGGKKFSYYVKTLERAGE